MMVDTIRIKAPAQWFDEELLETLRRMQHQRSESSWFTGVIEWCFSTAVKLPSWFKGFYLHVGQDVVLEGSPKVYQGHNLIGPANLLQAANNLVDFVLCDLFGFAPWQYPPSDIWQMVRFDVTDHLEWETAEQASIFMDHAAGLRRGIRRSSVEDGADPHARDAISFDGVGDSRTLYRGKRSRYRAGKIYFKGIEFLAHFPRDLLTTDKAQLIANDMKAVLRFELVMRALWLSDHAHELGLWPLNPAFFAMLSTSQGKEPITYFPVAWLHQKLDLSALWHSEFDIYFSRPIAMYDDTLLETLKTVTNERTATRAYDFYLRVRLLGFQAALKSIPQRTYYRYRKVLIEAGISDLMLQDGYAAVQLPLTKPVQVYQFEPRARHAAIIQDAYLEKLRLDVPKFRGLVSRFRPEGGTHAA